MSPALREPDGGVPAVTLPKIFLSYDPAENWGRDAVYAFALAEDGTGLGGHVSSNLYFAQHDIGLTSKWHHDEYEKHYPDGFQLEWIENKDLDTHEGFQRAFELNQKKKESSP